MSSTPIAQFSTGQQSTIEGRISPNAQYLASSGSHSGVQLWAIKDKQLLYTWRHTDTNNSDIFIVRFSPDSQFAVTASNKTFALWRLADGQAMGYWQVQTSTIRDIAVSDQAKHILIGQSDGKVVSFQPATGLRLEFLGHENKVNSVDIAANGQYALTGSNDYVAYLWQVNSGQVIYRFNHPSRVTKVSLDPSGQFAFTADSKQQANIWRLNTGELNSRLQIPSRQQIFSSVEFIHNGAFILTGSPSRQLALWNTNKGEKLKSWSVTGNPNAKPASAVIYSAQFDASEQTLLSFSSAGLLEQWQR